MDAIRHWTPLNFVAGALAGALVAWPAGLSHFLALLVGAALCGAIGAHYGGRREGVAGAGLAALGGVAAGLALAWLFRPLLEQSELLPQTIVNGLTLGSVYALIALGYSMVYGILKLLNFAHGDIYMIGAYMGYGMFILFFTEEGALIATALIIFIMLVVAMVGAGIVSVAVERFAYRPLRYAPRIAPLISALGVSFILQNLVQITVSPRPLSYGSGNLIASDNVFDVGDLRIHISRFLVVGTALALMVLLTYFVRGTRLGRAMRAVAMDLDAAQMMGVDVDQVIVATFFIGAVLAGAGGVLVGIVFFSIRHTMGFLAGLKGFTAAVIGGIGSVPGAALGGLLLGMAEAYASIYISVTFKDAYTFILLLVFLLLRPNGLLGRPLIEKA